MTRVQILAVAIFLVVAMTVVLVVITSQTWKMGGNFLLELLLDVVPTNVIMLMVFLNVYDLDRKLGVAQMRPRLRRVCRM